MVTASHTGVNFGRPLENMEKVLFNNSLPFSGLCLIHKRFSIKLKLAFRYIIIIYLDKLDIIEIYYSIA